MNKVINFLVGVILSCYSTQLLAESDATSSVTRICKVAATGQQYTCYIGKNGIAINKVEGDGTTPIGSFSVRRLFYRADKLTAQELAVLEQLKQRGFSVQPLTPDDGWCNDAKSPYYNQYIKLSTFSQDKLPSHENLWRDNDVYDIVVVISYNDQPVIPGKGSAIFMHVAKPTAAGGYSPTVGCIALVKQDLLKVSASLTVTTQIVIPAKGNVITIK